MKREPVIIAGRQVGRIRGSILLFKESFRFLRADKEMMLLPFIMGLLNIALFCALCFVAVIAAFGGSVFEEGVTRVLDERWFVYAFSFGAYIISSFTFALSQAGITHVVYTRLHNGDATLGEGVSVAWSHAGSLFVWALITSTVGMALRLILERSRLAGSIIVMFLGVAWSVLTYFVVPAIVIDKKSAFSAIPHSGTVFRTMWGETLVSNISLGLIFFLAHLIAIASAIGLTCLVLASAVAGEIVLLTLVGIWGLFVLWLFVASLVQATLEGILKTLLYVYAAEHSVPSNFNRELLEQMLKRNGTVSQASPVSAPPVLPTV